MKRSLVLLLALLFLIGCKPQPPEGYDPNQSLEFDFEQQTKFIENLIIPEKEVSERVTDREGERKFSIRAYRFEFQPNIIDVIKGIFTEMIPVIAGEDHDGILIQFQPF